MGCLEDTIDDLQQLQTQIDDARFFYQEDVYKKIAQYVNPCIYEFFLDMMKLSRQNDLYDFEEMWYSTFKLGYMHMIAVYEDEKTFEKEYMKLEGL